MTFLLSGVKRVVMCLSILTQVKEGEIVCVYHRTYSTLLGTLMCIIYDCNCLRSWWKRRWWVDVIKTWAVSLNKLPQWAERCLLQVNREWSMPRPIQPVHKQQLL